MNGPMRTALAFAVFATILGGMWITFDLLARDSRRRPVHPWME
ncbi:MAG: hypothetical protein ACOCVZ_06105 [Gemmatimonadota bacterium]